MSKRILLAGESWMSYTTHVKGFDAFYTSVYETGEKWLKAALIRALKTVCQTAVATIGTAQSPGSDRRRIPAVFRNRLDLDGTSVVLSEMGRTDHGVSSCFSVNHTGSHHTRKDFPPQSFDGKSTLLLHLSLDMKTELPR